MASASQTAASDVAVCARCGQRGHRAAACSRPFLRQLCTHCNRMGHGESACPVRRKAEWEARKAKVAEESSEQRVARAARAAEGPVCGLCFQRGHLESACRGRCLPRCLDCGQEGHRTGSSQCKMPGGRAAAATVAAVARAERRDGRSSRNDAKDEEDSNADARSDSVATSVSTAASSSQVPAEEREIRRLEKKLREIGKLEERLAAGEELDALQRAKLETRGELELDLESARGLALARARGAVAAAVTSSVR